MKKSSGAVSRRGDKLPAQGVVKPPSSPGTTVPESGAATAATVSPTPATHPSKAAGSLSGEISIAFVLYAESLFSIHQIAQLFEAVYDTVHTTIRAGEAALEGGFSRVWERIPHTIDGLTLID